MRSTIPATMCRFPHWGSDLTSGTHTWTMEPINFCKRSEPKELPSSVACPSRSEAERCKSIWHALMLPNGSKKHDLRTNDCLGELWEKASSSGNQRSREYVGISMLDITHTRRLELCLYAIEETQKEIKAAQLAMNGFAELCGTSKRVKTTIEGLEILATAVLALFFPKDILGRYWCVGGDVTTMACLACETTEQRKWCSRARKKDMQRIMIRSTSNTSA
ncbi:hypothetical protein D6C81_06585 [Aureobasidium pullulans]|nr:hypothetical protein D6C81_06585 [Aureobasidium pullulans]